MKPVGAKAGNRTDFTEGDLRDGTTVHGDEYRVIGFIEADSVRHYLWGFATSDRFDGNSGFSFADIKVTPDGGSTVNDLKGDLRLTSYHSAALDTKKAIGPVYRSQDLREAATESRTDRPIIPALNPVAGEDEVIALEAKVDSSQDGQEVYADGSALRLAVSELITAQS